VKNAQVLKNICESHFHETWGPGNIVEFVDPSSIDSSIGTCVGYLESQHRRIVAVTTCVATIDAYQVVQSVFERNIFFPFKRT